MIPIRRQHRAQPPGIALLNLSNPLTRGAQHWWLLQIGQEYRDLIGGWRPSLSSVSSSVYGDSEVLQYASGTSYVQPPLASVADIAVGTGDATYGIRVFLSSLAANTILMGKDSISARQFHFQINTSGSIAFVLSASTAVTSSNGAATTGRWLNIIYTRRSNNHTLYLNGAAIAGPTVQEHGNDATNAQLRIGARAYGAAENPVNGYIEQAWISTRAWSDMEVRMFQNNRWQVFASRHSGIPFGTAAAAPTLTAAIAHNLGATVVTPRVTFTR